MLKRKKGASFQWYSTANWIKSSLAFVVHPPRPQITSPTRSSAWYPQPKHPRVSLRRPASRSRACLTGSLRTHLLQAHGAFISSGHVTQLTVFFSPSLNGKLFEDRRLLPRAPGSLPCTQRSSIDVCGNTLQK